MRAQSAALGIAAAAAFSSAATALPCAETVLGQTTTSEFTCAVTDKTASQLGRDQRGDPGADAPKDGSPSAVDQSELFLAVTEAAGDENFVRRDIKITNLQATMTSNKYVAGRLPIAGEATPVEDLITFSPDYLSVKILPHIPMRKPVGVGLVTAPKKPAVKEPDTTPAGQWFPQPRP
jgi:hypothetical protein